MNLDANWCIPLGTSEAATQFTEDEKELVKQYGEFQDHYHDNEMMVALRQLPLAFQDRPEWNKKVCENFGFHSIEYNFLLDEGYWNPFLSLRYRAIPTFMLKAKK